MLQAVGMEPWLIDAKENSLMWAVEGAENTKIKY
jgi:hypothetical protein